MGRTAMDPLSKEQQEDLYITKEVQEEDVCSSCVGSHGPPGRRVVLYPYFLSLWMNIQKRSRVIWSVLLTMREETR